MLAVRLLPCSALLSNTTAAITSTSYFTNPPNSRFSIPFLSKSNKTRVTAAVFSNGASKKKTQYGSWEDPDDGSNTDYESQLEDREEEEEEDQELESEPEVEAASSSQTVSQTQYEANLITEVEQLLTPDERAILEQNEAPVLGKISTAKWGLLQTLALSQQIPFMDKMLLQGVGIDAPDKDGLTALHKAIIGKREAVISHLLRKGANPHARDNDAATPLHYAVQIGAIQTVKLLIKYKVDVNAEDNEGWTPLHVAIQSRCRDIAKILLVNGADKTRRTKDGISVLDLCLCYGKDFKSYELTKLVKLVPAGIDP